MAMWAGVQKVSRPMERCQDTSHCPPMVTDVTARAQHHRYHGTRAPVWARREAGWVKVAIATSASSIGQVPGPRQGNPGHVHGTANQGRRTKLYTRRREHCMLHRK